MRAILVAAIALLWSRAAFGQWAQASGPGPVPPLPIGTAAGTVAAGNDRSLNRNVFYAPSYGSCVWNSSNDVGPCILLAEAAAHANGGGTVIIPAGVYGQATEITQPYSYVHVQGAGVGAPRDNFAPGSFQSVTRLVWIGSAVSAPMMDVEPTGSESEYSADVTGIVFDCASLAAVCFKASQVSFSQFDVGVAEPTSIGAYFTTQVISDAPGTQRNAISIQGRCISSTLNATCAMIDGGLGSNLNVSFNPSVSINVLYDNGDGIVVGYADNNIYQLLTTQHIGSGAGTPIIFADTGYTSPNGISTAGPAEDETVLHVSSPVLVQGTRAAATIAAGTNAGSGVIATTTQTTSATGLGKSIFLSFNSTAGVVAGENINCGGAAGGVLPGNMVSSLTASTVTLNWPTSGPTASGLSCIFSWNTTINAVAGTYTITATSATTFNIAAPTGGHAQTGVTITGGIISFTDMIIPMTGTPTAGDTWVVTVPSPALRVSVGGIDNNNSVAYPTWEFGASGVYSGTGDQFQGVAGGGSNINLGNGAVGASNTGQINIGFGKSSVNAASAVNIGGAGNVVNCFGGAAAAGHNNTCNGPYNALLGGQNVNDRGDQVGPTYSSQAGAASGQMEMRSTILGYATTGTTQVQLSTTGAAPNSSTGLFRLSPFMAQGFGTVIVTAYDYQNHNACMWEVTHLLAKEGSTASTAALVGTPTVTQSQCDSTLTASALAVSADTTYGQVAFKVTGPSGINLHVVAWPYAVEAQ